MRPDGVGSLGGVSLPSRFRCALWVHDRFQVAPRLTLERGLRLDPGGRHPHTSLPPRLSGRLRLDAATTVGLAVGVHTQSTGFEKFLQRDYFFEGASMFDLSELTDHSLRNERA